MLSHTWKGKPPIITKPTIGNLKPIPKFEYIENSDHKSNQVSYLESLMLQQSEEINQLKKQLSEEKNKNKELEKKIQEMTEFLEDYGMKWVGGPRPSIQDFPNGPDYDLFIAKISELNDVVDSGKLEFQSTGNNIFTIAPPKSISLILYDNGFTLDDGEIRNYDKPINQSFIKDILDGFFPQEFKVNYPEGVKFNVQDKRKAKYFANNAGKKHSNLEMLAPPSDIGHGDGAVKLKIPALPETIIHVSAEMTVLDLLQIIEDSFDIHQIKIASPFSAESYNEESKLTEVGLYPRGYAHVVYK